MSWLSIFSSTLAWWQWGLLLAVPPAIVSLYFLKLKRHPLEVPSTYLWHRTIEDLHVNSIWQRLRQNLLLFLQLLLLALAILACLRPSWRGTKLTGDRFVFLVDNSASMSATDIAPTRLAAAKQQVELLLEEMKSGDVAMIIAFSDRAQAVQPFTENRRVLQRKLETIQPTNRGSDLEQALRFAAGLANPSSSAFEKGDAAAAEALPATLFIFSDGRVRSRPKFQMGNLEPVYVPMGMKTAKNLALSALQADFNPDKPDSLQAFVGVESYLDEGREVQINLYLNDVLLDAAKIQVPSHSASGADFTLDRVNRGILRAELVDRDDLALDNQAYSVLNPPRRLKLLYVRPSNEFLDLALKTEAVRKVAEVVTQTPDFLNTKEYREAAANSTFDLVFFDQCAPAKAEWMPLSNTIFLGRTPPGDSWMVDPRQSLPQIIDTDRAHPLMQFIEMGNTEIAECTPLQIPSGGTRLVDSDVGPLIGIAPRGSFEDCVIGFEIIGSNEQGEYFNSLWPRRASFPVFIHNALSYLGGLSQQQKSQSVRPGELVELRGDSLAGDAATETIKASPDDQLQVLMPDRQSINLRRGPRGTFSFGSTEQLGVYEVRSGNRSESSQRFTVNLFDSLESDIVPVDELQTEYEAIAGVAAVERTRREAWKPLLLLALGVLVFEWYIYNRRVYL